MRVLTLASRCSISLAQLRPELLAVGGSDATVRVYDRRRLGVSHAVPVAQFMPEEHQGGAYASVTGVAFSADGAQLLGSYLHGPVYLFDVVPQLAGGAPAAADSEQRAGVAPLHIARDEELSAAAEAGAAAAVAAVAAAAMLAAAASDMQGAAALISAALALHAADAHAHVPRAALARLRLARAEACLAMAAAAADNATAQHFAQTALEDAEAAAALAPREARAMRARWLLRCADNCSVCARAGPRAVRSGARAARAGPRARGAAAGGCCGGAVLERVAAALAR